MKILTWNCNGALWKKFGFLRAYGADVHVIQECENPAESNSNDYKQWACNYLWKGDKKQKGIGIFASPKFSLAPLNWSEEFEGNTLRHFLPCAVDNIQLIGVWTHFNDSPRFGYIGQLWIYLQLHKRKLMKSMLVGDFNSNVFWDRKSRWWNHSDVVRELKGMGIESVYHKFFNEDQGKETQPTFFLQRNLKKPYHIDYCFASSDLHSKLKTVSVQRFRQWKKLSDHVPLIIEFDP